MLGIGLNRRNIRRRLIALITSMPSEGQLYNELVLKNGKEIAPAGWRISTPKDFNDAIDHLGGGDTGKNKMKATTEWNDPNNTNESGLTILPVGLRSSDGKFIERNKQAIFWTK